MHKEEIALNLTLKALEQNIIQVDKYMYDTEEEMEKCNKFNSKQIFDFVNSLMANIDI